MFSLNIVLAAGRYVLYFTGLPRTGFNPTYDIDIQAKYAQGVMAVPIPGAIALFGAGLGLVSALALRRKSKERPVSPDC
jgi:hypothetical protein